MMNRKQYIAPELELLILEQTDIITVSGAGGGKPAEGGIGGSGGSENSGVEDNFGWDS